MPEKEKQLMESRHDKLMRLATEMCARELDINPECAEYQLLD